MQPRYNYTNRRSGPSQKTIMYIGVGIGIFVMLVFGLWLLARPGADTSIMQRLVGRLDLLQQITQDATKHAKSDDMRKLNSELSLHIAGDLPAMENLAKSRGIKLEKKLITDPETEEILADLKAAAVNDNYDDVYERIVTVKLDETLEYLADARAAINRRSAREEIDGVHDHLSAIRERL